MLVVFDALLFYIGLLAVAYARQIVSWQASRYKRAYSDPKALAIADRLYALSPLTGFFMGSLTRYVTMGSEHPEEFPRLVWANRMIGLITMMASTAVFLFVLARH